MEQSGIWDEVIHDFGIKTPRVVISGKFAVVDSIKRIYVLSEDIVTLKTSEGYVSILGKEISVKTLCDERIELTGEFQGVEFIRPEKKSGRKRERTGKRDGRDGTSGVKKWRKNAEEAEGKE